MAGRFFYLFGAVVVVLIAALGTASWHLANLDESFDANMLAFQAHASLLVGQQDAHLAALDAVAEAGSIELFDQVAADIMRAYPRILAVALVSGDAQRLRAGDAGQYKLTSPSAQRAVELTIDAQDLLLQGTEDIQASLALPDGKLLIGQTVDDPQFVATLDSASQPLVLSARLDPAWSSILPLWPTLGAAALAFVCYTLAVLAGRQWQRARQAERRATLGENLARLEHASRINGLGEMASGIAHELTQPLAAILSQTQAGRRLLERGDIASVSSVLDDTIVQTKRASAILGKLRQWVSGGQHRRAAVLVVDAVASVESLVRGELRQRNCAFEQIQSDPALRVYVDAVQLEQVIFNLARNAMDAIADETGSIVVTTRRDHQSAIIEVRDNGAGLPDAIKSRLFEPFVTSKPGGLGLGLALCQRLVESMGGRLEFVDGTQTTFRIVLPIFNEA